MFLAFHFDVNSIVEWRLRIILSVFENGFPRIKELFFSEESERFISFLLRPHGSNEPKVSNQNISCLSLLIRNYWSKPVRWIGSNRLMTVHTERLARFPTLSEIWRWQIKWVPPFRCIILNFVFQHMKVCFKKSGMYV